MRSNKLDLDFYSPTMNLGRDPRWGRNDESYGEDPLLEAKVAGQFVNGMEGKDQNGQLLPDGQRLLQGDDDAQALRAEQHRGHSNSDPNGRLNGSSNADDRTIREYYTMPFRKIVQASQNGAIMSSYNSVNGVPSAAERVPDRHADARRRSASRATSRATATRSTRSTPRHHWQPTGFGRTSRRSSSSSRSRSAPARTRSATPATTARGNYRGPTVAEHDRRAG